MLAASLGRAALRLAGARLGRRVAEDPPWASRTLLLMRGRTQRAAAFCSATGKRGGRTGAKKDDASQPGDADKPKRRRSQKSTKKEIAAAADTSWIPPDIRLSDEQFQRLDVKFFDRLQPSYASIVKDITETSQQFAARGESLPPKLEACLNIAKVGEDFAGLRFRRLKMDPVEFQVSISKLLDRIDELFPSAQYLESLPSAEGGESAPSPGKLVKRVVDDIMVQLDDMQPQLPDGLEGAEATELQPAAAAAAAAVVEPSQEELQGKAAQRKQEEEEEKGSLRDLPPLRASKKEGDSLIIGGVAPTETSPLFPHESANKTVDQWMDEARGVKKLKCLFCNPDVTPEQRYKLEYTNINLLLRFINDRGMILQRRESGVCAKHQRKLARVIKLARQLALLNPGSRFVPPREHFFAMQDHMREMFQRDVRERNQ